MWFRHLRVIAVCLTTALGILLCGCERAEVPSSATAPQPAVAASKIDSAVIPAQVGRPESVSSPEEPVLTPPNVTAELAVRPSWIDRLGATAGLSTSAGNTGGQATRGTPQRNMDETLISPRGDGSDIETIMAYNPDEAGHRQLIVPFLNRRCLKCHGPEVQEADFRVDQHLPNDFLTRSATEKWSEVLDMLNAGEMPPEGEPDPPSQDIERVAEWITRERLRAEEARKLTSTVLRRMNRAEYNNTIRDLVGVEMRPADSFPADPASGGFDNNGVALTISPLQMELYLKAAQDVLDRAIITSQHRPPVIKWRFQLEEGNLGMDRYRVNVDGQRIIVNGGNNSFRDDMTVLRFDDWDTSAGFRDFRVPHAGEYIVRIRAAGIVPPETAARVAGPRFHERRQQEQERKLPSDEERQRRRGEFDMWVKPYVQRHFESDRRYRYGPARIKLARYVGGTLSILGEFDVDGPADNPKVYEIKAWFDPLPAGIDARNVYRIAQHDFNFWMQKHADFPRPELLIDWMEIEGPLYDDWLPSSHHRIFIDSPHKGRDEEAYARDVLTHFMRRAYRRPPREGEIDAKLSLFRRVRPDRASFEDALKTPLIAILCSPHFLYLVEPDREADGKLRSPLESISNGSFTKKDSRGAGALMLDDHELATRLSYFLWSSMPDDELFTLAEQGRLASRQVLMAQVDRMLAHPRSEQFVKNFAGQWLGLRDVGANPPAENLFPRYDDHLEVSMRGESEAFFAHVLHNDLSALNFLRSDFVTINERLARFYDIPGVKGDHFRAVPVPPTSYRGGLVTQASILTVTSNGTRTSPVRRGVWILERLLGDPPPPPPPNAGDIPPGVPGHDKATVRERLRLHREQSQCARCHNKIDPLGFALENFNAAGEWRDREAGNNSSQAGPNDPPIDASAQLPGGDEFVGIEGLRNELLKRDDQFLRCLTEKMYSYALGRELGFADAPAVDRAAGHMKQNDYTMRSLIHHIVTSDLFLAK